MIHVSKGNTQLIVAGLVIKPDLLSVKYKLPGGGVVGTGVEVVVVEVVDVVVVEVVVVDVVVVEVVVVVGAGVVVGFA